MPGKSSEYLKAVHIANFFQSQTVGVNPIFISKDLKEDPRVEGFKEALHKDYDGVELRTDLPPVRTTQTEDLMGTRTFPW